MKLLPTRPGLLLKSKGYCLCVLKPKANAKGSAIIGEDAVVEVVGGEG